MKSRRNLSVVLILVMLMSLFTACEVNGDKWVLTKEVKEYSDEYDTPTISYQKTFEYDLSGRIVAEKEVDYDFDIWYSSYDFEYNDDGQVIAKTVEGDDETFPEHNISHYEYRYNSYGNCVSEKVAYPQDPDTTYYTEYTYDKNGNVIEEYYKDTIFGDSYEITKTRKLTYEENKCIQAEITTISSDNIASFSVEEFIYDENGNPRQKLFYKGIEKSNEAKKPLTIENRSYKLDYTITYTYEKLKDVAVAQDENTSQATITTTTRKNTSEWGFNDVSEWGNKLVEIQHDETGKILFEDNNGHYVVMKSGTSFWEFYPNQGQVVTSSVYEDFNVSRSKSHNYTVLDNDTFSSDGYTIRLTDRIVEDKAIIFQILDGSIYEYYIPFELIDTSKGTPAEGERSNYFKIYLK